MIQRQEYITKDWANMKKHIISQEIDVQDLEEAIYDYLT